MYNFSSPEKPVGIGCIAPSNSYADNKFDIHNIKGNMAEMTTIKGMHRLIGWVSDVYVSFRKVSKV